MTPNPPADPHRLPASDAAYLLGVTERWLRQLAREHPDLPCVGRGKARRYLWPQLREWRERQLVQQTLRSVRPQNFEEARARKVAAEAELKEIELAERQQALMPSALFRQELEGAYARVRAKMLNAGARFGPQLLAALADRLRTSDLPRVEEFIGQMMQELMADLEAGDDIPDDEEEEPHAA